MATLPSILNGEIPWTEEPGGLQSMGSQRVGHVLATTPPPPILQYDLVTCLGVHCQEILWTEEPGELQSMGSQKS